MRNKSTNERSAIQAGDTVTIYKYSTHANQIKIRRPGNPRESELLNFEGKHPKDDNDRLVCSHSPAIELICQITGLQAVKQISNEMFDEYILQPGDSLLSDTINPEIKREEFEQINNALKKHKGKRKNAAAELGISERTLYRRYQELSKFFEFEA